MWYNEILARKTLTRLERSDNNGIFQECQHARVVFHQGRLSSGWYFVRLVPFQADISLEWSLNSVVFLQGGPSSGWYFIRVVPRQAGISSGWSLVRLVFHQDGPSSGWYFVRVVLRQGGISSVWYLVRVSLIRVVSREGAFDHCGLSSRCCCFLFFIRVASYLHNLSSGVSLSGFIRGVPL